MKSDLEESRHYNETLTDNVAMKKCAQCKDCIFNNDGTVWSNEYTKSSCIMFPYPNFKPLRVIRNEGFCDFRKENRNGK